LFIIVFFFFVVVVVFFFVVEVLRTVWVWSKVAHVVLGGLGLFVRLCGCANTNVVRVRLQEGVGALCVITARNKKNPSTDGPRTELATANNKPRHFAFRECRWPAGKA
jgi:hypothetical protein